MIAGPFAHATSDPPWPLTVQFEGGQCDHWAASNDYEVFVSALFAVALVIPPALADEREDAYASIERWSEAFNFGDVEQIVRVYTNDALVLGTLSPGMTTKSDDLRAYFKAAAAAKLRVRFGDHSAVALAEDAVVIAGFYDFSTPAGGQPVGGELATLA